jgi:ATP-binding cassette subfamily B protein
MWAVNDSFFPFFIKHIVNGVEFYHGPADQIFSAVAWPLIALIALWFLTEITGRTQGFVGVYLFPKFRAQIRESVLRYVKKHSQEYFVNQFAGNIAKKLSDLPSSSQNIVENICYQFVPATTGVIMVLIMMWVTKPIFAWVVWVWLMLHMSFTLIFMRLGQHLWESQSEAASVLSGKIIDVLTNMLNVRLFARGEYEMQYLKLYQEDEIKKSQ